MASAQPLITPVMIVRDEGRHLPGALAAFTTLGDVLAPACVYDTGSVDETRELARDAGAHVEDGHWDDDFARARNAASELATTPWVLVVDADERVVGDARLLRAAVMRADAHGLDALVIEVDDRRGDQVVNTAPSIRLFRPAVAEYRGRVHETVIPRGGGPLSTAVIPREALHLVHVGYVPGEAMERRYVRNTRLGDLEVAAARQEGDAARIIEALVNRGRSRKIGEDVAGALADWHEARAADSRSPFRLLAGEYLAAHSIDVGELDAATRMLRELRAEGSDPQWLAWHTGEVFSRAGRPDEALACLRLVEAPRTALGERVSPARAMQARMLLAAERGDHEDALADAVQLMAGHGVYGFAGLVLALWQDRPAAGLADLLASVGAAHLHRLADEFAALGGAGADVADALRR